MVGWNRKFWTPRPSLTKDEIIRAELSVRLVPSSRFAIASVCMVTMMNMFLLRTHFNFAMVCMVKPLNPGRDAFILPNDTDPVLEPNSGLLRNANPVQTSTVGEDFVPGETFFGDSPSPHDVLTNAANSADNMLYPGLGGESMYDIFGTRSLLSVTTTLTVTDPAGGQRGHHSIVKGHRSPLENDEDFAVTITPFSKGDEAGYSRQEIAGGDEAHETCAQKYPGTVLHYEGEFEWSKPLQGALFGSFYYGYISSMVIGGMIGDLMSAKWLLLMGTTLTGLLTLLIPSAAWVSPHAVVAIRALQGIASGLAVPCVHQLVASWASPTERPILMGLAYSGVSLGYALSSPFASFFCSSTSTGWPWIFYVSGIWSCLCLGLILAFVYDSPADHPKISPEEKDYLLTVAPHSQAKKGERNMIPWASLLTSPPFIAICVCHFCINWGFYVLAIMLPTYMKDVLKFDVRENGILSALPYIGTAAIQLTMGRPIEWLRRGRKLSTTTVRKACNTFGMLAPSLALLSLSSVNCSNRYFGVALTVAAQSLLGICFVGGFFVNHADLAPRYAGTMMGITNTVGNIQGFLAPQLTTLLTPHGTREEWLVVFYIGAAAYAFGAVFFLIFGSGEVQPWAKQSTPAEAGDANESGERGLGSKDHPQLNENGVSPEALAVRITDAILAAAERKGSGCAAGGNEGVEMQFIHRGFSSDDGANSAAAPANAVASGEAVCRRLSRGHLKPMVPGLDEIDEKGW